MRNILTIAGREIRSSFVTPLAYVVLSGFLFLAGFFFFGLLQNFNSFLVQAAMMPGASPSLNEWVISPYYQTLEITLVFLVPILTMRSIAEERRAGTFELIATSPLSINDIVFGKFLGVSFLLVVMLLLSFVFPLVLIIAADPEVLPVLVGLLGVILSALAFVAIGIAISCFTKSQVVAGVVGLVVLLMLFLIDVPGQKLGGPIADVLNYLAPTRHLEPMVRGLLEGSDVIYFLSLTAFGLFLANRVLDAERWR